MHVHVSSSSNKAVSSLFHVLLCTFFTHTLSIEMTACIHESPGLENSASSEILGLFIMIFVSVIRSGLACTELPQNCTAFFWVLWNGEVIYSLDLRRSYS